MDIICKGQDWSLAPSGGWGLNEFIFKRPFDVLFDMHNIPQDVKSGVRRKGRVERMYDKVEKLGIPLYSLEAWEGTPCIKYPFEAVRDFFGIDYFVSSIDYMIALAIFRKPDEINLWGAYFGATGIEYGHQMPSATFWFGVAHGMGIRVSVKTKTKMFSMSSVYGYDTKPELINNFIGACPNPQVQ